MRVKLSVFLIITLTAVIASHAFAAPTGGIFIPRNGGYEACMGKSHVFIDTASGGVIRVISGEWPRAERLAETDMVFNVKRRDSSTVVPVRQSYDKNPDIIIIEEGNDRIGVRVKFKLYDETELYHGYGITETWMYPDGVMYFSGGVCFEDSLAHEAIVDARLTFTVDKGYESLDTGSGRRFPLSQAVKTVAFDDTAIPGRSVLLDGGRKPGFGVFWLTGKLDLYTWAARTYADPKNTGAPSYFRWPTHLPQALPKLRTTSTTVSAIDYSKGRVDFIWLKNTNAAEVNPTFYTNIRIAAPSDAAMLKACVDAERNLLKLDVKGGTLIDNKNNQIGYIDNEGVYQVRKTSDPMTITLPADPSGRTIYIKTICLDGHGAVVTELDGQPVVPHLASEGGVVDDPLAPIRELPEGPADMAIVTVKLGARPRTLVLRETDGVQYVYQTRDKWREVMFFGTKTGKRWSGFRFSLVDGRARNIRQYGQREWALTENLLTWFKYCGQSPIDMNDQLRDFRIMKNGPDEAIFYYKSVDANERAQSEYIVRVAADSPVMQMNISTTFTVLESWPYSTCQFFDIFPFRGVDPREWWYDTAVWLTPDGRSKFEDTHQWTFEGDKSLVEIAGDGFFALTGSDKGNMIMLNHDFRPSLPVSYIICGNYIDYHMDVHFSGPDGKPSPPKKGFTMRMNYDLALWGDKASTREEIIGIGKNSLKAGKLVLPNR